MNHKLFKALLEYKPSDEQLKSYCSGFAERVKEREKAFGLYRPYAIYRNGEKIGYVHDLSYITEARVAETIGSGENVAGRFSISIGLRSNDLRRRYCRCYGFKTKLSITGRRFIIPSMCTWNIT